LAIVGGVPQGRDALVLQPHGIAEREDLRGERRADDIAAPKRDLDRRMFRRGPLVGIGQHEARLAFVDTKRETHGAAYGARRIVGLAIENEIEMRAVLAQSAERPVDVIGGRQRVVAVDQAPEHAAFVAAAAGIPAAQRLDTHLWSHDRTSRTAPCAILAARYAAFSSSFCTAAS
jgi:hypothetical protein